jgi:hypothetical protein
MPSECSTAHLETHGFWKVQALMAIHHAEQKAHGLQARAVSGGIGLQEHFADQAPNLQPF